MRFIICICSFDKFKIGEQYATPYCSLGPNVRQFSYQIYSKPDYKFICNISDKVFNKHFMYCGDYQIELDWCEELFNLLMDGANDMYKIV